MTPSNAGPDSGPAPISAVQGVVIRLVLTAALLIGLVGQLVGWDRPLWIDEAFTGGIAFQPRLSVLITDCLNENGGPIYYSLAWAWVKLFGASNDSLRASSFVFAALAPVLILWRGDRDWIVRGVWAALIALCYMVAFHAHEARAYGLLLLLGTVQVLLFRAVVNQPTAARAYGWVAVSAVFTLTHLLTLPLTGLQWLALVAVRGRVLARFWPAMLIFLVPLGWLILQAPTFARNMQYGAWQPLVDMAVIFELERSLFGWVAPLNWAIRLVIAVAALTMAWDGLRAARGQSPFPYATADVLAVACALGALATLLLYGHFRPSFTPRYVAHQLPALFLALAIWSRRAMPIVPLMPAAVIALFAAMAAIMAARTAADPSLNRDKFTWQPAAEALMAARVSHVAILWDNPASKVLPQDMVRRAGGFFFDRAASGITTEAINLSTRTDNPDPNLVLPRLLDARRRNGERDAFLWMARRQQDNQWSRHPVRLDELSRQFACRDHSTTPLILILACVRRMDGPASPA